MRSRRALVLPVVLAVSALAACTGDPVVTDSGMDVAATDASCTQCTAVTETDGALRYNVCNSTTEGCACLIFPDGAVQDPTFC